MICTRRTVSEYQADHYVGDWKKLQSQAGISDEDLKQFLSYIAQFLGNTGMSC
jgi:hypothetical protein